MEGPTQDETAPNDQAEMPETWSITCAPADDGVLYPAFVNQNNVTQRERPVNLNLDTTEASRQYNLAVEAWMRRHPDMAHRVIVSWNLGPRVPG